MWLGTSLDRTTKLLTSGSFITLGVDQSVTYQYWGWASNLRRISSVIAK